MYRIKWGDTLGGIARKWKPKGVTYQQMLIGLFQANPSVFIHDNINLIRAGETLLIPEREAVIAIRAVDANRQVRIHMAEFRKYRREHAARAAAPAVAPTQTRRDTLSGRIAVKKSTRAM